MRTKFVLCGSMLLCCGVLVTSNLLAGPPESRRNAPGDDAAPFMRAKLASMQKILEGLTSKKFDLIRDGANELKKMSDAADWRRSNDAVYIHYSREFSRLAEKQAALAVDRNLEGASFTYMHIVSTCLSCHEHARDVLRIASVNSTDFPSRHPKAELLIQRGQP